jgi:hypothetical protein
MSSAFLYVGIVAIWAFVLVPRWLRRSHALPDSTTGDGADVSYADDAQPEAGDDEETLADAGPPAAPAQPTPAQPTPARPAPPQPTPEGTTPAQPTARRRRRRSAQPLSRSRVLQARRRLLTMLVLLAVIAGTCAGLKLTHWWVCAPPAGMLGLYLLLLREAGHADAELTRRRAARHQQVMAARQRAADERLEYASQPSAQVIDISARIADQLYDQYADATVRAVGD